MVKTIFFSLLAAVFALSLGFTGSPVRAAGGHQGQIVKMDGLSSLYYVAADNKRYVFPNDKTYKSWFPDFENVTTLTQAELTALPLGRNILYRPGVLLVKITTDPKVYAVAKGGVLRWIKTEAIARALYGDSWNKLVDDVPDSFFTNYSVGSAINSAADYNPENEADNVDNIDANHGLANATALRARTRKCRIVNNARDCRTDGSDTAADNANGSNDHSAPYITKISVSNRGTNGYIDKDDEIAITFSEAIDPASINPSLEADDFVNSLDESITGAVNLASDGTITVNDIAAFDLGSVDGSGQFAVKLSLNASAKTLTVTIISGNEIRINDEDFDDAEQIGGTVKDAAGNTMEDDPNIGKPDGSFGGVNVNDGIAPYITSIKAYNNGSDSYIDEGDEIAITFSEEVDAHSINSTLEKDGSVDNVLYNKTGGVMVAQNGMLTVTHIATFFVGDTGDNGDFDVSLALNPTGRILTITLANGDDIALDNENLNDAAQIGGTVKDKDGNKMASDPKIDDPVGSFASESTGGDLYITYAKAYNNGYTGYIDEGDKIVITFNRAIDPDSINGGGYAEYGETGGVYIYDSGLLTVTDIMSFDVGDVASDGEFQTKLSLDAAHKVLTITLQDGNPVKIDRELFADASQIGGYIVDESGDFAMEDQGSIDTPTGTFGGDSVDSPPYITAIAASNSGQAGYINTGDKITITFSEAVDPISVNTDLEPGSYVRNVSYNETGGVSVGDDGTLTIADIAEFNIGDIDNDTDFSVKLSLNSIGNVLTITLETGDDMQINYQDFGDASQIGGYLQDTDGNNMASDPRIDDPTGSF